MPDSDHRALAAQLEAGLEALGIALAPARQARLVDYVRLLARWNRAYNLSAVRDPGDMVTRHVLDSLAVQPWIGDGPLLDIGTGAGLPGIPLAIAQPGLRVALLDSNGKKARFLRQACLELGLAECSVVQARAEAATGVYPLVSARAFASLAAFWAVAAPRLAPGGRALAFKGRHHADELSALAGMGVSWRSFPLEVPGLAAERHVVELTAEPTRRAREQSTDPRP